jgi:hypothetical protein
LPQVGADDPIDVAPPPEIASPDLTIAFRAGDPASATREIRALNLPTVEVVASAPIEITAGDDAAARPRVQGIVLASASADALIPEDATRTGDPAAGERPAEDDMLQFDEMQVPRWLVETILRAAEVTEVDPVYMMALADKESSFLPDIKSASSSAEGLFQFLSSTWLEMVQRFGAKHGLATEAEAIQSANGQFTVADAAMRDRILGLRRDPYVSALMAGEMMKRDRSRIESRLGRPITRPEFYLAHFFGVDSASKFMSLLDDKPKQSAPRVFPAAARANKSLFFAKDGRKTRHLTVAEVYDKIDDMIDERLERYEDVAVVATADASL